MMKLTFKSRTELYTAYMPFIFNGGLFIHTRKAYRLGEELFLLITLLDSPNELPVAGKIVWITPRHAQGNKAEGIGVQFIDMGKAKAEIEKLLSGALTSDRMTHTM